MGEGKQDRIIQGEGKYLLRNNAAAENNRESSLWGECIILISLEIWISINILKRTWFAGQVLPFVIHDGYRYYCLLLLLTAELIFGRKNKKSAVAAIVAILAVMIAYRAGNKTMVDTICFVFAARDIPFKKTARFSMIISSCIVLLVIITSLLGVIPNPAYYAENRVTRYSLGFAHPNNGPLFSSFIFMSWAYLRDKRFGIIDAVCIFAFEAFLFYYTNSRTSLIITIILVITMLFFSFRPDSENIKNHKYAMILASGVACIAVFSIAISLLYNPDIAWMEALNKTLSGRIELSHRAFEAYGVSALGKKITFGAASNYNLITGEWIKRKNELILDNMYTRILVNFGWIFSLSAIAAVTFMNYKLATLRQYRLLAIISIAGICGLMEYAPALLYYNPFLMLIIRPYFCNNKQI